MSVAEKEILSKEDYIKGEESSEIKHEFIDGDVWAMVGATDRHVSITMNIALLLKQALKGKPCRAFISDMKVQVDTANAYFYPDVLVTCDTKDKENTLFKKHPVFIAEVLSPSTEAYDRGRKFGYYRQLESLKIYWLVDTESMSLDCFEKNENGDWMLKSYAESDAIMALDALGLSVSMGDIYDEIEF